ncbi:MAG: DNA-protecting protein DprA [Alphaproteobacteria bacterium]|nr:DNA-protecting protein DprA [Alphaproteobacteria bacterium]
MSEEDRRAWLRLLRSENVGPRTFFALLQRFGTAKSALSALPDLARRAGRARALGIASERAIDKECADGAAMGATLLAMGDPHFPEPLAALDPPPPLLWVLGDPALLTRDTVAIVGARNASTNGRNLARALARELGEAGWLIASGLARGIDTAAHEGSLQTGTAAVLAGGIDNIYPPDNAALYGKIRGSGAILSEMPIGFAPVAQHFPRRNRIISGLARGVIVVEAAMNSGSLITARLAGEQGREVFAVPGSPLDARAKGCNQLLRNGAVLTETAADVLNVLTAPYARRPAPGALSEPALEELDEARADDLRAQLLARLAPAPTGIDALARDLGAPAGEIATLLLELEIAGLARRHPGGTVSRLEESP